MTPKEKAIDLRNKFIPLTRKWDGCKYVWNDDEYDAAECALFAVTVVEDSLKSFPDSISCHMLPFWNEVKQEIEKL